MDTSKMIEAFQGILLQIEVRRRREAEETEKTTGRKCIHKNKKLSISSVEDFITNSAMEVKHLVKEIVDKARPLINAGEDPKLRVIK